MPCAEITCHFTVRWYPVLADLGPRDRMVDRGRVYNITAVRQTELNRWLEIDAVAPSVGD